MSRPAVAIPEKLFFKIGEVCELAGVQAHVLRYWESEFPMLAPQKNRAGQRVYRKRDVEMALRIKELLYEDQYTIAGAKKRLTNELRGGGKLKVVGSEEDGAGASEANASDASASAVNGVSGASAISHSSAFSASSQPTAPSQTDAASVPAAALASSERNANGGNNVARRSAEERQGLKQIASELRELLALLEQENNGRTK
jgi:DNA-binding transcriptional MerR regulator